MTTGGWEDSVAVVVVQNEAGSEPQSSEVRLLVSLAVRQMHGEAAGCSIHPFPLPQRSASHLPKLDGASRPGSVRRREGADDGRRAS